MRWLKATAISTTFDTAFFCPPPRISGIGHRSACSPAGLSFFRKTLLIRALFTEITNRIFPLILLHAAIKAYTYE
jgi:hypothetical protein